MERLTDEMLQRLKETAAKFKAGVAEMIEGDSDGWRYCTREGDVLFTDKDLTIAISSYPLLTAEVERLREQMKEYREALKPFAEAAAEPGLHLTYYLHDLIHDEDLNHAKVLLDKEG